MDYPINHHVLAEDFREQAAGRKAYNQGDGEWLHKALVTMCNAYDEIVDSRGYWVVGLHKEAQRLAICNSQEQAEEYVGTLPNALDGRYYIDGPCFDVIKLDRPTPLPLYLFEWCKARLRDSRESEEIDRDTPDNVIQREAYKLEGRVHQVASSFVDNEFDERPVTDGA